MHASNFPLTKKKEKKKEEIIIKMPYKEKRIAKGRRLG
jgi:hypothetical protein